MSFDGRLYTQSLIENTDNLHPTDLSHGGTPEKNKTIHSPGAKYSFNAGLRNPERYVISVGGEDGGSYDEVEIIGTFEEVKRFLDKLQGLA
jgi:hypothetical protein